MQLPSDALNSCSFDLGMVWMGRPCLRNGSPVGCVSASPNPTGRRSTTPHSGQSIVNMWCCSVDGIVEWCVHDAAVHVLNVSIHQVLSHGHDFFSGSVLADATRATRDMS